MLALENIRRFIIMFLCLVAALQPSAQQIKLSAISCLSIASALLVLFLVANDENRSALRTPAQIRRCWAL